VYDVVLKKFTFAISSADEFLVETWWKTLCKQPRPFRGRP